MQDLAFGHQVLDRAGDILDRHLRIDPMLVEQVDAVGAQALQHAFDHQLDVIGPAVEAGSALSGLQVDVPAELRGDDDLVAEGRDAFAEDPLDLVRAVGLRGIDRRSRRDRRPSG